MKLGVTLNREAEGDRYVASSIRNPDTTKFGFIGVSLRFFITTALLDENYLTENEARQVALDIIKRYKIPEEEVEFTYGRLPK